MANLGVLIRTVALIAFLASPIIFSQQGAKVIGIAFLFVLIGSFISSLLTYGPQRLISTFRQVFKQPPHVHPFQTRMTIRQLLKLQKNYQKNQTITDQLNPIDSSFFAESVRLVSEKVFALQSMNQVLEERIKTRYKDQIAHAYVLFRIGRFPVIWGLLAAFAGLIIHSKTGVMNLPGSEFDFVFNAGIFSMIFGLVTSYMVLIPMADSLMEKADKARQENRMIAIGLSSIVQKSNPIVLFEKLNSLVAYNHKARWDDVVADWESEAS